MYTLKYEEKFLYRGSVEFRYRANTRVIRGKTKNGVFKFSVDGVDLNVADELIQSGTWQTYSADLEPGYHTLQWQYIRYNNYDDTSRQSTFEDLAAEIEYIKVKGVSYSPRECTVCMKGEATLLQDRCQECLANWFYDDQAALGGKCLKCPEEKYSYPGSLGMSSCKPRPSCTEDDMAVNYDQCHE